MNLNCHPANRHLTILASSYCTVFQVPLLLPNNVTVIESSVFYRCIRFNESLIIPNSMEIIEYSAFSKSTVFVGPLVLPHSQKLEIICFLNA